MRTVTKALLAFGFIAGGAALTIPGSTPAQAQGFYIDAPGIHVGVGHRHHRYYRHYRGYDAYGYEPYGGYGYYGGNGYYIGRSGYPQCARPGFTFQDGVCKPYRGY